MPSADIHRRNLLAILQAALTRVNGRGCVQRYLQAHPQTTPIFLIAIGKAAGAMSLGAIDVLEDRIHDGLVITKHGHEETLPWSCLTAGGATSSPEPLALGGGVRHSRLQRRAQARVANQRWSIGVAVGTPVGVVSNDFRCTRQ
jgi:hypothetical protein